MECNNEYELLQEIYRGARMGAESIRLLLPKVDNARVPLGPPNPEPSVPDHRLQRGAADEGAGPVPSGTGR